MPILWTAWLDEAGVRDLVAICGPTFSHAGFAIESAELGHGAALASRLLAENRLADGRLCAPFALDIADGAYGLLAASFERLRGAEQAFCEWLSGGMHHQSGS